MSIRETILKLKEELPSGVELVAVSKFHPADAVREAYAAGQRIFAESRPQELYAKVKELAAVTGADGTPAYSDIIWHFIGHLQTNKIKYVLGRACMIHSVDTLHLAEALEAECRKRNLDMDILVEINVAEEASKFGMGVDAAEQLVRDIAKLSHLHIQGLMTIAPFVENPEQNRSIFRQLKQLSVDITAKNIDNVTMNVLSMGMTGDYQIAIEEGATHIRVGTGIFGERNYNR